ncbi:MAG: hypothetical protein MUP81_03230 [Dehalococcoidia bacterium]|nr:hypothetical protein [Dehalococcoidia bacterium]
MQEGEDKVYLYTHWGADELPETVKKALSKKWRWDDFEYLARIVFETMIDGDRNGETGFGIGTGQHDDIECLVVVDVGNQTVVIDRSMYGGKKKEAVSFEQFCRP